MAITAAVTTSAIFFLVNMVATFALTARSFMRLKAI
jgi:hypothetical protein